MCNDITFCNNMNCERNCRRHMKFLPDNLIYMSMSDFGDRNDGENCKYFLEISIYGFK